MIRAVAFDLDDTLMLERDFIRSGFRAVGRLLEQRFGRPFDWSARLWDGFLAGVRGNAFDRVLAEAGIESAPELIAELVRTYREHEPNVAPLPDVVPALESLALPRDRVGVITDGPPLMQRSKFRALGLDDWIGHLIVTDEWGVEFRKPHPRAFETFEQRVGASPGSCAYVSDNPAKDFAAPHARGWTTIRIRREGGLHAAAPSAPGEVDHEIARLDAAVDLVRRSET